MSRVLLSRVTCDRCGTAEEFPEHTPPDDLANWIRLRTARWWAAGDKLCSAAEPTTDLCPTCGERLFATLARLPAKSASEIRNG